MKQTILIIEDDRALRQGLERFLLKAGFEVLTADSAESGHEVLREESVDLLVLDLMLPGQSGLQLCKRLRGEGAHLPIIMLTALAEDSDKVLGLEVGADDYVTKPFSLNELVARIRANLRRFVPSDSTISGVTFGDVAVDFRQFVAKRDGQPVHLPAKAFGLLHALVKRRGDVAARDELMSEVWGFDAMLSTRTVDNHVSVLRGQLERDPPRPEHILTVHGAGYRFVGGTTS